MAQGRRYGPHGTGAFIWLISIMLFLFPTFPALVAPTAASPVRLVGVAGLVAIGAFIHRCKQIGIYLDDDALRIIRWLGTTSIPREAVVGAAPVPGRAAIPTVVIGLRLRDGSDLVVQVVSTHGGFTAGEQYIENTARTITEWATIDR